MSVHDDIAQAMAYRRLVKRMLVWAAALLKRQSWRGDFGGAPPGAVEAQDLVQRAFEALLPIDRSILSYDDPQLQDQLKAVIRTEVTRLRRRHENDDVRLDRILEHDGELRLLTQEGDSFSRSSHSLDQLHPMEESIYYTQATKQVGRSLQEDSKARRIALFMLAEGVTEPRFIADALNCQLGEVNAAKRRISRKLAPVFRSPVRKRDTMDEE